MERTNTKDKKNQKIKFYFLLLTSRFLLKKGQSILEYTIVLGVIVIIMFTMGPMLKRGTQSLIKLVADQVGVQKNADQRFDDSGHLEASYAAARGSMDKQTLDFVGSTTDVFNDLTSTQSNALINLGFTEQR